MAEAVCQGSRSWSDPGFHLPRDPPVPFNLGLSSNPFTGRRTNCSFLEAILTADQSIEVDGQRPAQKQRVYVHTPVVNLELCTENLGNETGSDMSDSESVEACAYSTSMRIREERPLKLSKGEAKKEKKYLGFPPPLTTIKGKEPLRYKTCRERGRLILEAVKTSPVNSIFQAKRSHGRLTLSFLNDLAPNSDNHVEEEEEHGIGIQKKEDEVGGDKDGVLAADIRTAATFKRPTRCKDGDHRRQLQHENRGLLNLNLGDIIIWYHLVNIRWIFLVALLSAIC
ncbi:hypothetical protein MLD38_027349 [Melastoma candidum]|uniref:Uncharacterized protein n=1 Tax=Melastoma candidum TaxID=119954 RepID=A0ACB9P2F3_9MYRT|nr:hypothetical protein MLD38_027349 [Melastoma candidum]